MRTDPRCVFRLSLAFLLAAAATVPIASADPTDSLGVTLPEPPIDESIELSLELSVPPVPAPITLEVPTTINVTLANGSVQVTLGNFDTTSAASAPSLTLQERLPDNAEGAPLPEAPIVAAVGAAVQVSAGVAVAVHAADGLWWRDVLRWRETVPFATLFARIRRERLLDHPLRDRIYTEIRNHAGIHYRGLLRSLGVSNGTLAFHLSHLERAGYIRSERVRGRRCLHVTDRPWKSEDVPMTDRQRRILEYVRSAPSASPREIMQALRLTRATVRYQINVLRALGLIELRGVGRRKRCVLRGS